MTDTTLPDRPPRVSHVSVHDLRADHVLVESSRSGHTWVSLGPVSIFADPDELMAIGNELVRQAAVVDVEHRVEAAVNEDEIQP